MKIKKMLLGLLLTTPFAAFAVGNVVFQNYTDANLTVHYQQCTDYPFTQCSNEITTPPISKQTPFLVQATGNYTYVVITGASTDDSWTYQDPQTGEDCDMIKFYTSGAPHMANLSKSLLKYSLQCQTNKISK